MGINRIKRYPGHRDGASNQGSSACSLKSKAEYHPGEVTFRKLNKATTKDMFHKLSDKRKELSRKPYEKSEMELLKAAWDKFGGASSGEDLSSLFCSELVAEGYQSRGLLDEYPKGLPSNEYTPADFSKRRKLKLNHGYQLGREMPLTI